MLFTIFSLRIRDRLALMFTYFSALIVAIYVYRQDKAVKPGNRSKSGMTTKRDCFGASVPPSGHFSHFNELISASSGFRYTFQQYQTHKALVGSLFPAESKLAPYAFRPRNNCPTGTTHDICPLSLHLLRKCYIDTHWSFATKRKADTQTCQIEQGQTSWGGREGLKNGHGDGERNHLASDSDASRS